MTTAYQEIMVNIGGGLNTSNNPSSIDPDQLVEAIGMEYRPPRQGLFAVLGRTRADYGATALGGTKVQGLVRVKVAESTTGTNLRAENYFVNFYGSSAWMASADSDGQLQFRHLNTGVGAVRWQNTATAFAKITHFADEFYCYNGNDRNLRLSGPVFRTGTPDLSPHGMIAVTASASSVATAFAGATLKGDYEVWWTESYQSSVVPESAYNGTPTKQTISATGLAILVTLPAGAPTNPGATNGTLWCGIAGQKYPFGYANQYLGSIASGNQYYITSEVTDLNAVTPNSNNFYETVGPPDGVSVSRDDRPPKAYDMTVFQDCLVCIDSDDRSLLKYSMPGFPSSFPSVHYIPFELESNDDLNAVTVCNNALLVFTSFNGFRVDDLPFATDGDNIFAARGRAKEPFSIKHGCLSPLGYAVFEVFGSGQLCVFICRDGIHITDGFKTDYCSTDLDWYNTVDSASLNRATLYNNPKYQRIEFRYIDKTDTTAWKCLDFYYHPQMLKESRTGSIGEGNQTIRGFPRMPILGPRDVPGPVATLGTLNGDWQTWSGSDYGATAFSEASGTTDGAQRVDANGTINKSWKTKDFYPFGMSREGNIYNVFTHQSNVTASGSYTVTGQYVIDEANTPYSATSTVDHSKKGAQSHFDLHSRTQRFNLRGEKNDTGPFQEINYIVLVVDKYGKMRSSASTV